MAAFVPRMIATLRFAIAEFPHMRRAFAVRSMSTAAGFAGGLAAGCAFLAVELAARVFAGVPTLPELVQDRIIRALPGPVFAFMLNRLLYLGKPAFFAALLLLQLVIAGVAGVAIARWHRALPIVAALWLLTGFALLPAAGRAPFDGDFGVAISLSLAFVAYVFALRLFWNDAPEPDAAPTEPARASNSIARRELVVGGVLFLASAALARRAIGALPKLPPRGRGKTAAITSQADFYVVSKNISDPAVGLDDWRLEVLGLVDRPLTLTYDEIRAMPSEEIVRTLECISNGVGGDLISNGRWTGIRLADLLKRTGIRTDARVVHFTSADDYTENMPIQKALDPETFLVYLLDGEPLSTRHGFPLRVLGAGTYGMKNPKWLTRIELAAAAPEGFWEDQGWTDEAVVQTMSRIDAPEKGRVDPVASGIIEIEGIAFAGDRGIRSVEVSTDGEHWRAADLDPALGPLTWVFWHDSEPLRPGSYDILVRATDGTGQPQTHEEAFSFPNGATGYHQIRIRVDG